MKFSIKDFFTKCDHADLTTFTEEILNGKLQFLYSVYNSTLLFITDFLLLFFFVLFLEFYLRDNDKGLCLEYFDDKFGPGFNCASFIQFQNHFMHSSKKCLKLVSNKMVQLWECNRTNVEIMENSGIKVLVKEKHISINGIVARARHFSGFNMAKFINTPLILDWGSNGRVSAVIGYLHSLSHDSKEELRKICQNTSFLWRVFSRITTESNILSLYGKLWVRENPHCGMFCAVKVVALVRRCRAQHFDRSQLPVTTGGFELRTFYM